MDKLRNCLKKLGKNLSPNDEAMIRERLPQFGGDEIRATQDYLSQLKDEREEFFPQVLSQESLPDINTQEDNKWRNWTPDISEDGVIKNGPEWVESKADYNKLLKRMRKFTQEGSSGRYWYEKSAKAVMQLVGNDDRVNRKGASHHRECLVFPSIADEKDGTD